MTDLEKLYKAQSKLGKQVKAAKLQYHQLPEERKNLKAVQEKLEKLEEAWKAIDETDTQIRESYPDNREHAYFIEDLYGELKALYEEFKEELAEKIKVLTSPIERPSEAIRQGRQAAVGSQFEVKAKQIIRRCLMKQAAIQTSLNRIVLEEQSAEYYETKIQRLRSDWDSIKKDNEEIHSLLEDPANYGYDVAEIFELDETVQELIIKLKQRLSSTKVPAYGMAEAQTSRAAAVKLPTITIPQFNGDYFKWPQFHDMFQKMIDNQPIESVEKMWYLKANITGEAEKLIRHLNICEQNYTVAWNILRERYENKRLLVTTILDRLLSQPNIAADSAKALKTMYDSTRECILTLENTGIKVNGVWDPFLLHILIKKLDRASHTSYEQGLKHPKELQTLEEFLRFIESRFQALEALGTKPASPRAVSSASRATAFSVIKGPFKCVVCGKVHLVAQCAEFVEKTTNEKEAIIKKHGLCINCLKKGHERATCYSGGCEKCGQKHHTLIHKEETAKATANIADTTVCQKDEYVFLATALITVYTRNGSMLDCRVLLDSGSQVNFITERLQKRLQLDTKNKQLDIYGIGNGHLQSTERVCLKLKSRTTNYETMLEAQVIKEITHLHPQKFINISSWNIPQRIKLADPRFNQPQRVDMLLGAEMYGELMRSGQLKIQPNLPTLQNTVLGWVILGKLSQPTKAFVGVSNEQLEDQLAKFWECEDITTTKPLSASEGQCEEFFINTTFRQKDGRFSVNLPILGATELLGDSKAIAWKRFVNLENKLATNPYLHREYTQFLDDYLQQGHMQEIREEDLPRTHYFLPHHGVLRPDKSTTRLRVVFDASCKTSSNLSLNDIMMKGAKVQDDLFNILLRFRSYKYVILADIKQMFRQIEVAPEDRPLQLIMWRRSPKDQIQYYQLNTVTYGTKAAPFLATRCLKQLAEEEGIRYPQGARAIQDCYMDDIITGGNTMCETLKMRDQLIKMLASAKFQLHKWASNHEPLLQGIPQVQREKEKQFNPEESGYIKTLGLSWQYTQDNFTFTTVWPDRGDKLTKRRVVSEAAQLFDPLGLVNPVIVKAKIFIQRLWKLKLDWDQELNEKLRQEWTSFREGLSALHSLKIGRQVVNVHEASRIEMHAFSDASVKAYGAAIYIRSIQPNGKIQSKLLCSRSRVAPVKVITVPRLELCAAQLATELVEKAKLALNVKIHETYLWTDSQIVLYWVKGDPAAYKTYVAHRIATIQKRSRPEQWNYINTKYNPADIVSRGALPQQLMASELWFNGPDFFKSSEDFWPPRGCSVTKFEEEERRVVTLARHEIPQTDSVHPIYRIDHRNSFTFLQRTVAYMQRAIKRMKKEPPSTTEWLTTQELNEAANLIFQVIQNAYFKEEQQQLKEKIDLSPRSHIASLAPIIDKQGLIRVGGRLENSDTTYDAKHPILLPGVDFVSKLLLEHLHRKHLHAGPLALLAISRQRYWIIGGRSLARATTGKCVACAKARPQLLTQKMGNLPQARVLPTRPFLSTGVDFCGPIWTHYHLRGKRPTKSYIAVFCCFSTKAIHMEVVSDLSTDGFLGALRRFMARRGFCKDLHCDNATNFVGAKNRLEELSTLLHSKEEKEKIVRNCSENEIQFHFSPPRAPHFGGLWEAAVKSAKRLLRKTLSSASLTFEELSTVTAEAEAILNSRPLTPLSASPNDYSALTPGHFLIGEPLTTIPDPATPERQLSSLARWKLVSAIRRELWKRWYFEYLSELQHRYKWKKATVNIEPGMLVIIKEDNVAPLKWPMGKIEEVYKGNDGLVRVASVRTANGIFRRAIHKMAPLPIETTQEQRGEGSKGITKRKGDIEDMQMKSPTKRRSIAVNAVI